MAQAITYRTGQNASKLRTVIVDQAKTIVLVASGGLEIMTGNALCGTSSRCEFWTEELGADYHDFAIPVSQVHDIRDIKIAVKVKAHE
jgi:hypothetical protein